ncbi:hypothetical protein [Actinoallomurus oryzae]
MGSMIALLVRSPYEVARLRSSQHWPGDFTEETDCGDGWRAAFSDDGPQDMNGAVQAYMRETGCSALLFLILDEGCALVHTAVPGGPTRHAILGLRTAIGAGIDTTGYQVAETRQELLAWAYAAGTAPRPDMLDTVLFHDGGEGLGIKLTAGLFAGLGIPDFRDTNPFEPSAQQDDKVITGPKQEVEAEAVMLARSPVNISKLRAAYGWPGGWGHEQKFKKNWRAASSGEWPDDTHGVLNAFATETGGPVLLSYVTDAGFVIVKGTSRPGQYWETVLGLDAAHAVGHGAQYDESDIYPFHKNSRIWSADAGLTSDDQTLRIAYERPGALGEEVPLLFVLYAGLGIPGCEHIPPYWDGSPLEPDAGGWVIVPSFQISFG